MKNDDLILRLLSLNAQAAFNRWAGFEITAAVPGDVEIRMAWREDLGQYSNFLHAGLIGALLDTACGYAAFTQAGPVLASHFSVNCLVPAIGDVFFARGKVVKMGKRQIFTRAKLFAENAERHRTMVATGETMLIPTLQLSTINAQ